MIAPWPQSQDEEEWESEKTSQFLEVQEVIRRIRNHRSEMKIKPSVKLSEVMIEAGDLTSTMIQQSDTITSLARIEIDNFEIIEYLEQKPQDNIVLVTGSSSIYLPSTGGMDVSEERSRLEKQKDQTLSQIDRLSKLLSGPFAQKAPPEVVDKEREKLAQYQKTADQINNQLDEL